MAIPDHERIGGTRLGPVLAQRADGVRARAQGQVRGVAGRLGDAPQALPRGDDDRVCRGLRQAAQHLRLDPKAVAAAGGNALHVAQVDEGGQQPVDAGLGPAHHLGDLRQAHTLGRFLRQQPHDVEQRERAMHALRTGARPQFVRRVRRIERGGAPEDSGASAHRGLVITRRIIHRSGIAHGSPSSLRGGCAPRRSCQVHGSSCIHDAERFSALRGHWSPQNRGIRL
jgi:hypothetical protein